MSEPARVRCMGYYAFQQTLAGNNPVFVQQLEPLKRFLQDLSPEQDCRWQRLQAMYSALADLEKRCEELLNLSTS